MQVCAQFNPGKPKSSEILESLRGLFKSEKSNPQNTDAGVSLFSRVYIRCFCHLFLFANNFAVSNSSNASRKSTAIGKKLLIYVLLLLCFNNNSKAQTTTELFEDETAASHTFTNNSKVFDLTGNFHITNYAGQGYGPSDQFIDNYGNCLTAAGIIGSIKPHASGYVKVSSLWLFSSADCEFVSNNGTATITGKKSGVIQYTISLTSADLNNLQSVNNGFKLITFSSYTSADTKDVDELEFAVGGTLRYLAIDNFTYTYVPLTDASAVIFSSTLPTSTGISWTNGTGTSRAVFVKAASAGFPSPVDNSTYTANTAFLSGTQISSTGWYCVYNGTGTGVAVTGLTANTAYRAMVVESNGSLGSQKYSVGTTALNNPNNVTTSGAAVLSASINTHVNVSCNSGSNGSAIVTASGGTSPYTYSWSPAGGTGASATGLFAGTYTLTVTDAVSASTTANVTISQPPALATTGSQTNVSCNGGSNGSATVASSGGTPSYTYSWSPAGGTAPTATGLVAGTYTVTVTDANGCTAPRSFTLTQPPAISTATGSQTNVSCNGGSNGSATVAPSGGTPSYTYSWSPAGGTAATATGLAAGTYTVTVTDANGCTAPRSYTITEPSAINTATGSQTNVSCNGGSNGSATVAPSGGTPSYTYSWSPAGGTAATATGLVAGTYTVTVTDANGCTAPRSYTITEPSAINTATGSQTNVSCNGGSNGSVTVAPSGGTPSYTYSWSPAGGTAATATGLVAGTYTVTVTDANGCTAPRSFTLTQPPAISMATGSQTNVSCNGGSNGSATVAPSGGTPSYTYSWSPSGGTAATATGLVAGTYTVTVTDANGCTAPRSYTITEPSAINTATGSQTNVSCNGGSNGSATVAPSGGTPGYSYSWSPAGGTAVTATGLVAGTYTITITDANGCTASRSYTITEPSAISTATGSQTNVSCNGGSNGSAAVAPSGGTPGYTYSWSPSGGTAATASGLVAGTYTVIITDANGCTATRSYTITEPSIITVTTSQTNVGCNGSSTGLASVIASGGTGSYTYSWSPSGGTGSAASDLTAGVYTCTITDANTCSVAKGFTITESPAITATTSQVNVTCTGGSTGTATVVASGGTGTITYSWSPSEVTDAMVSDLAAGDYTCTITDENLCSIIKTFTITEPASIPGSNSYLLPTSNQTVTRTAGTSNFVSSTCELVSTVLASGTSPVSGMVTSNVWIEGAVPTDNGLPFVQRHYEITPASNATDATGTVILYFTQAEFDNFNAHSGSTLNLPVNAADDAGKANLRIGKYSGISGDGTGLPSSYSGSAMVIDPADNDIVWNAVSGSWEVTFIVDGFSGFVVQTSVFILPVKWVSFTAKKQGQSVMLNWSTAAEQNTKDFSIQHSIDGLRWNTIAILAAAGNTGNLHTYSYLDNNTVKGYNYYRVMQTDVDGKTNYSEMRVVKLSGDYAPFTVLGNQVDNGVLRVQVHQITTLSLYEVNGKLLWVKPFTAGLQSIDVSRYAKGIYLLTTAGKAQKIFIQ